MFTKLLKYEFKSVGKWYLSLYGVIAALSVIIGLWFRSTVARNIESKSSEPIFLTILFLALYFLIIAIFISTTVLITRRFYQNIYGRQGYLTMTLPVSSHQILLSKLTTALIWNVLALLAVVVSLSFIAFLGILPAIRTVSSSDMAYVIETIQRHLDIAIIFHILSYGLTSLIAGILQIYFSISLGQLFKDHRIFLAFVFYFGISFAQTIPFTWLSLVTPADEFAFFGSPILPVFYILLSLVFYFGTHYIMTKKVNLQ